MEEEMRKAETHDPWPYSWWREEACETEKNAVMSYYIAAETYQIIE